jgi:hypothetical protein
MSLGGVNRKEILDLRQDRARTAASCSRWRGDRVAVHRIARPHHACAFALHRADQARQMLADLVAAEARDQRQAAGLVVGLSMSIS